MKSLIIGNGQVGSSLYKVLKDTHETYIRDVEDLAVENVEVLHICIPFFENFIEIVNGYIRQYKPRITVNHSSVEVGTSEKLDGLVVYSPIRGKHPNLDGDIRVFEKFIAGTSESVPIIKKYFEDAGLSVTAYEDPKMMRSLEYCKLMSNIRYGYEIAFMQEAERIAKKLGCSIETFQLFESTYNIGYDLTGHSNMKRPVIYGGVIGGHCVMQNCDIIQPQVGSEMIDWIQFSNMKKKSDLLNS